MPSTEYVSIPLEEFERLCEAARERDELMRRVYDEEPTLAFPSYGLPLWSKEELEQRRKARQKSSRLVTLFVIILSAAAVLSLGYAVGKILESLL